MIIVMEHVSSIMFPVTLGIVPKVWNAFDANFDWYVLTGNVHIFQGFFPGDYP
jgi:hypothetical protein